MQKSHVIIEKSQNRSLSVGAGWWFVLQGRFDELAPLGFVDRSCSIDMGGGVVQPVTVADAQVRNGVLSVKLDGVDGSKVPRQARLVIDS